MEKSKVCGENTLFHRALTASLELADEECGEENDEEGGGEEELGDSAPSSERLLMHSSIS